MHWHSVPSMHSLSVVKYKLTNCEMWFKILSQNGTRNKRKRVTNDYIGVVYIFHVI